jgi:hypothetical protein
VARPSDKTVDYRARAARMQWTDLDALWGEIKKGVTPDWDDGKALEYLVPRAFQLSALEIEYSYDVPPGGKRIEEIDGLVYLDNIPFLLECKDKESSDITAIAKLRNQLLRRPDTTFGCVFVAGEFTEPALILADYSVPLRILLWSGGNIENGLRQRDFAAILREKYRQLCMYGFTDHSPNFKELKI